ncbi:glycosyltransferase family 4 protein [Kitasatospora arboriphila]|uniref:Glycosyltransferase n=1 Tax=Kitasatospora arboriphila TaxID=258052 RepID=A0ABP4EIE2_9ACTN
MTAATRPRVALVHSFYGSAVPSGENRAVLDQARALERAGCEIFVVAARTDDLSRTPLYPLRAAATVATGSSRSPLSELRRLAPDVVHVHNLFPNFGRSWLRQWPGPLVATLHNYRPLCAAATLYRDGTDCTRCPDGDRWAGLRHRCYRGSRTATLPLAWAGRRGPAADALLTRADRAVVLSPTALRTYAGAGVPAQRMELVPNFVAAGPRTGPGPGTARGPWGFAGRIGAEKGLLELIHRWPAHEPLEVVGDGPLRSACEAAAPVSVRFLGTLDHSALRQRMAGWCGLVFPGRCREGAAPLVCLEALAAGVPVLARAGTSAAAQTEADGTGAVFGDRDPLPAVLASAAERFPSLRPHCRRVFTEQYSEQSWTERMLRVYRTAQEARPC